MDDFDELFDLDGEDDYNGEDLNLMNEPFADTQVQDDDLDGDGMKQNVKY
jgi:hypothetical protein